jgi:hemolysin secretion protein
MPTRSEEVQDIIERMPTRWCAWVALIVSMLMSMLIGLSFLISYPDTVDGEVSITGANAPLRLVSRSNGRLHLLKEPNQTISQNATIAYIESGASYNDVQLLKAYLERSPKTLPSNLKLGELGGSYNSYLIAVEHWERLMKSDRYKTMRKSIEAQIGSNKEVVQQLSNSLGFKEKVLYNLQKAMERDSILASKKVVSKSELEQTQNSLLTQAEAEASLRSSQLMKQAEIKTSQIEIARSHIEEDEQLEAAYIDMMAKRNLLQTELRLWEEKYVIKAPTNGKLDYLGFWRENLMIKEGVELFTILPQHGEIMGEAYIPAIGAGKVKVGQLVNVKLNDYPYDEFGLLCGKVVSISPLINKVQMNNAVVETYLVRIAFPQGATTNFDHKLSLNFESKGTAEIVTKPKRLIERLFDNLKAKSTK